MDHKFHFKDIVQVINKKSFYFGFTGEVIDVNHTDFSEQDSEYVVYSEDSKKLKTFHAYELELYRPKFVRLPWS